MRNLASIAGNGGLTNSKARSSRNVALWDLGFLVTSSSGGVAHDPRTLLIPGQARVLLKRLSREATEARNCSMKLQALDCGAELANQLLEIAGHLECLVGPNTCHSMRPACCLDVEPGHARMHGFCIAFGTDDANGPAVPLHMCVCVCVRAGYKQLRVLELAEKNESADYEDPSGVTCRGTCSRSSRNVAWHGCDGVPAPSTALHLDPSQACAGSREATWAKSLSRPGLHGSLRLCRSSSPRWSLGDRCSRQSPGWHAAWRAPCGPRR